MNIYLILHYYFYRHQSTIVEKLINLGLKFFLIILFESVNAKETFI